MRHLFRALPRLLVVGILTFGGLFPSHSTAHAANPVLFGIDEGYKAPTFFQKSGATWDRINFFWNSFQPNGPTDWFGNANSTDADLASDLAMGMDVVGVITNPPAWATRNGSVPSNLSLAPDDPTNYWGAFVHHLAAQYAGRINTWIIWNEPDIQPGQPGSTWAGSELEYYELLKTANLAAHSANPNVKIVFAGTTYWSDFNAHRPQFLQRVLTAAQSDPTAAPNGYYFDAVDIHIYSSPYQVYSIPSTYREILQTFGLSKAIWISEMNIVPWNDPVSTVPHGGFRATLDEQSSYMIEALAMARAAGVERASVYKLLDGTLIKGEPFGLVRNDQSTRPAYNAYQVATQYLNQPGGATLQSNNGTDLVIINNGDRRIVIAWDTTPTAIDFPIAPQGTSAQLIDKAGTVTGLPLPNDPAQPNYVLHLTAATDNSDDGDPNDYIVGGAPQIFVENGLGQGIMIGPNSIFYPTTGFVVNGSYFDYFQHRGGLRTFGYPISRPFKFMGSEVQFFQRRVLQTQPDGSVGQLNLLDADYMPYTQINQATFPAVDPALTKTLPSPNDKNYTNEILKYVQAATPDNWSGLPVRFDQTFTSTVTVQDAFPTGKPNLNLLPGINLELWGVPTSAPAVDPSNHNFVYQRFQRGIMHYDESTGVTQGLLLADYFKSVITGQNVPSDLASEAAASRFYHQYDPTKPGWVANPVLLPNTDLTWAFERQAAIP